MHTVHAQLSKHTHTLSLSLSISETDTHTQTLTYINESRIVAIGHEKDFLTL